MKVYEKPVVSVDAGMAEGVYAASGATDQIEITYKDKYNWGPQDAYNYTISWNAGRLFLLSLTFDQKIERAIGGTQTIKVSGNTVIFEYSWGLTSSTDITVVTAAGLSELKVISSSCDIKE
mgnify:CR=1 FL=1